MNQVNEIEQSVTKVQAVQFSVKKSLTYQTEDLKTRAQKPPQGWVE